MFLPLLDIIKKNTIQSLPGRLRKLVTEARSNELAFLSRSAVKDIRGQLLNNLKKKTLYGMSLNLCKEQVVTKFPDNF